jgi:ubiquinone/menaquinone biosynthesis C-methylase UbiE
VGSIESISDHLKQQVLDNCAGYYRDTLGLEDWQLRSANRTQRLYEKGAFRRLKDLVGDISNKTLLDVGCGWGGVAIEAAREARHVVGIEPDLERLGIARRFAQELNLQNLELLDAVGENLPFANDSFDIVISHQVLEHVDTPEKVIAEIYRVLKPGGVFHFSTPNYMSFWEMHYKLVWLPLFPKSLARIYLRAMGRNPAFIGHIKYVNPPLIHRLLHKHGFTFRDLRHEQVCEQLDRKLGKLKWLIPARQAIVYGLHTCFLNRDQHYIAVKQHPLGR